jgi:hypothetical protein
MSDFKFADLIKPGEGAKAALEKEVARQAELEKFTPGQWYGGQAEMLKAHGTYFRGRVLPDQYDDVKGEMTQCHVNALTACEAHPELRYFTGLYAVGISITHHSWCVDPDGEVVEVTYPTKGPEAGGVIADHQHRPTNLGWLPPPSWAYIGLEFDASFIRAWYDRTGSLPLLYDLPPELRPFAFGKPYSPRGFAMPTQAQMDAWIASREAELAAMSRDEDDDGEV